MEKQPKKRILNENKMTSKKAKYIEMIIDYGFLALFLLSVKIAIAWFCQFLNSLFK